jgi:hypothetical protein
MLWILHWFIFRSGVVLGPWKIVVVQRFVDLVVAVRIGHLCVCVCVCVCISLLNSGELH